MDTPYFSTIYTRHLARIRVNQFKAMIKIVYGLFDKTNYNLAFRISQGLFRATHSIIFYLQTKNLKSDYMALINTTLISKCAVECCLALLNC